MQKTKISIARWTLIGQEVFCLLPVIWEPSIPQTSIQIWLSRCKQSIGLSLMESLSSNLKLP